MRGRHRRGARWFSEHLREQGYRCTVPRALIIDVLRAMPGHPSVEEIYFEAHKRYPQIGLTTVYRTLELLVRTGVVLKFDFGDGRTRFEMAGDFQGKAHHHHLICTSCGKIVEYTDFIKEELDLLKKTEDALSKKYGFAVQSHLLQFYGVCCVCLKKREQS